MNAPPLENNVTTAFALIAEAANAIFIKSKTRILMERHERGVKH